jgi:hypothetical protein
MEGELWKGVYRVVTEVGKQGRSRCVQFSDAHVVLVFLWSVLNQRPTSWACDPQNWPAPQRQVPRPSPSTMSRRLRRPAVQAFLDEVERRCQQVFPASGLRCLDGKPLPIGGASADPDAGYGVAASGTRARGYKLHVIWDGGGAVAARKVAPMNVSERTIARRLIPRLLDTGFLLADNSYDSNPLYDLAGAHHHQLLAARRSGVKGLGHHRHSIYRLHAVRMLEDGLGIFLLKQRRAIERQFGSLSNFSAGLGPLPNWVRRLPRVRRWVQGKLILNALRIARNKGLAA